MEFIDFYKETTALWDTLYKKGRFTKEVCEHRAATSAYLRYRNYKQNVNPATETHPAFHLAQKFFDYR